MLCCNDTVAERKSIRLGVENFIKILQTKVHWLKESHVEELNDAICQKTGKITARQEFGLFANL